MDGYDIMHELSRRTKTPMSEIARRMGTSPQSLYKSLHGNIGFERMKKLIEICGCSLVIVDENSRLVKRL